MTEALTPRDAGDLFVQTFRVVWKSLQRLLVAQLLIFGPLTLLGGVGFGAIALYVGSLGDDDLSVSVTAAAVGIFTFLVTMLAAPVSEAVSILIVSDQFTGQHTKISDAFRVTFRRIGALIGLGFVRTAIISAGFLIAGAVGALLYLTAGEEVGVIVGFVLAAIAVVPAVRFTCAFFVSTGGLLVEQLGVVAALQRSRSLTDGFRSKILILIVLVTIIMIAIGTLFAAPAVVLTAVPIEGLGTAAEILVDIVNQVIGGMISASLTVVVYFDLRVRKDSFDLDNLADLVDEIRARAEGDAEGNTAESETQSPPSEEGGDVS